MDFAGLQADHDVTAVTVATPDVVHLYASRNAGSFVFRGITAPVVTNARPKRGWFSRGPAISISPIDEPGFRLVPEAVEERYFESVWGPASAGHGGLKPAHTQKPAHTHRIACFGRKSTKNIVEQMAVRLHRFRDDIEILTFHEAPTPEELIALDAWFDPAIDAGDFDGFAAEAAVSGLPVVASRTPINVWRLEQGRTGFLVPPNDPNELTHAILSALFKAEVAQQKIEAARQTMTKFRSRHRLRALTAIYESLHP